MAIATPALRQDLQVDQDSLWLRSRRWDLIFITFSVIVVPLPYLLYLLLTSDILQLEADLSRNIINGFVAIAVGGPHMMSTFLRTGLDENFKKRYPMLIRSTVIVPVIVVSLAFLNLELLLTVFFFWASTHVLHQITYIVELYNHKERKFARPGEKPYQSALSPLPVSSIMPSSSLRSSQSLPIRSARGNLISARMTSRVSSPASSSKPGSS